MIYYINEFFFKKKKKDTQFTISKEDQEKEEKRLYEKYKDKDKLPSKNELSALYICKYTPSDMDKFCNKSDTDKVKKDLNARIDGLDSDDKDADIAKSQAQSFKEDGALIILNNYNLEDGSIVYNKYTKKVYYPNNDESYYATGSWNDFLNDL